ncbi:MAG TPA: CPBP family intramembrane glutamic endopeptidase [Verrucomicrobiae bacterium]|nr:CPBP family intramembrane glutamic endopeptidase [Verrucomicrobiae bacterium]
MTSQIAVALLLPPLLLLSPREMLAEVQLMLVASALVYVVAVLLVIGVPALFRAWPSKRALLQTLGIAQKPTWRQLAWSPIAYIIYFALTAVVISFIAQLVPSFDLAQEQDLGFSNISALHEYVAAFVALVICAPIAEELLFRGFLFGKLRERLAFIPTALAVSLLFGFVHGQWNVAIDTFFLSLALSYLREKSGTLWPSMLLHMIKNGVAYYFLFVQPVSIV